MKVSRYVRLVRETAWYDLLVTWPFALPWVMAWLYPQLGELSLWLALPGRMPPLDAMHMLLANLMGSVVVVWSLARILAPTVLLGRLDAVARGLFVSWQLYAVASGASALLLVFTVFDALFGLLQALPLTRETPAAVAGSRPMAG